MNVCLKVPLSDVDCARRNALSEKTPGLALHPGMFGTVVDVFENGNSYMVEFNDEGTGRCQWLGLLRPSEIQFVWQIVRDARPHPLGE
jgi:hypothetical protein